MRLQALAAAMVAAAVMLPAQAADATPTLYAALGERPGLERLMTEFVGRLRADPRIGSLFKDTNATHLANQLRDQLCEIADGPCKYEGPSMKRAHEGMGLNRGHFNALVEVLQDTMQAQKVPFAVQNRLVARLAPMYRDIVEPAQP